MTKIGSLYSKPKVLGFSMFQILFFSLMWVSKTVHILYFEKSDKLMNFGASYSAMALAGYFSFLIGALADILGFRRVLLLGGILYSVGLTLRAYPESFVLAISSGLIAGVGASCVLCALRIWMVDMASEDSMARLVGIKSATSSFGTAIGCALAGLIPTYFMAANSMQGLLIGTGIGMALLTIVFYFRGSSSQMKKEKTAIVSPFKHIKEIFKSSKSLFFMTLILGITTGFYVSFISPYLPLIMKDKGLDLLSIGLSTGAFAMIRFFIDPLIAQWVEKQKHRSLQIFLTAEILVALVTGGLLWPVSKGAFVILLVLRSAFLGFSTISEEVLWLRTFPKEKVGMLFGLNQSGFFLGDFLGGLMNGYLYKNYGLENCVFIVLLIMLVNAMMFLKFFKTRPVPLVPFNNVEVSC